MRLLNGFDWRGMLRSLAIVAATLAIGFAYFRAIVYWMQQ